MANVLHKTRDPVDYRTSVNEPDYPQEDWWWSPDISAVENVPRKYWARPLTNPVTEMSQAEKDALDAADAGTAVTNEKDGAKNFHDASSSDSRALRAVVKLLVDELNILRALHSLPDRTYAQARNQIGSMIDSE